MTYLAFIEVNIKKMEFKSKFYRPSLPISYWNTCQEVFLLFRIVATSQMHPTHARKTFPCFDEPSMKAVFFITVLHPPGTVALSNGMETGQFQVKSCKHMFIH